MLEKTFGEKIEKVRYKDRAGVYAIIFDGKGNIAVVNTPEGYFLIGGGIEDGETHQECLKRECSEETGYDLEVKDFVCKGNKYFYAKSRERHFYLICYFYISELREKLKEPIETDHEFEWIAAQDIQEKLFFEHHIWAVNKAIRLSEISQK